VEEVEDPPFSLSHGDTIVRRAALEPSLKFTGKMRRWS
jgi:hypothetical protein